MVTSSYKTTENNSQVPHFPSVLQHFNLSHKPQIKSFIIINNKVVYALFKHHITNMIKTRIRLEVEILMFI